MRNLKTRSVRWRNHFLLLDPRNRSAQQTESQYHEKGLVNVSFILFKRLLRLIFKSCLIFVYAKTHETSVTFDITSWYQFISVWANNANTMYDVIIYDKETSYPERHHQIIFISSPLPTHWHVLCGTLSTSIIYFLRKCRKHLQLSWDWRSAPLFVYFTMFWSTGLF